MGNRRALKKKIGFFGPFYKWFFEANHSSCDAGSALKSGLVPVLGSSGLRPWTGPVLIFPNMEGPQTGPHKTSFTWSWAVLVVLKGPVLRTACGPETGPNWTETDQTFGPGPCF